MVKILTIVIIAGIILFLVISEVSITAKPFRISLPSWPLGVGIILMIIGAFFVYLNGMRKGKELAQKETIEMLKEYTEKVENKK